MKIRFVQGTDLPARLAASDQRSHGRADVRATIVTKNETVPLKDHIDALNAQRDRYEDILRAEHRRYDDRERQWTSEEFTKHNNLLRAW